MSFESCMERLENIRFEMSFMSFQAYFFQLHHLFDSRYIIYCQFVSMENMVIHT